jgi:hypothetical protein
MENTTITETTATTETVLATQTAATEPTTPTPPPAPSLTTRPDYIPAKFWDESKGEPKLDQLGASYISLEKAFSSKREIKKPGTDAKPEDVAAYQAEVRKITGAPEKPEGYGIKAPEGKELAPIAGEFAELAHQYGAAPEFVHKAVDLYNKAMGDLVNQSAEAQKASFDTEFVGAMNAEWKDQAANNWQRVNRGAAALGVDPAAFNPDADIRFIQRELAKAALGTDKLIGDDPKLIGSDSAQSTYEERMDKIRASDAYQGKLGPAKQEEAAAQLRQLFNASRAK